MIRCPSSKRRSHRKTSCIIRKTVQVIKDNYIEYQDQIGKELINGIDTQALLNEKEISNIFYNILHPYDKHFTFSPMVIDNHKNHKYNKKYFDDWIKVKMIDSIAIIQFKEFPDFELTQQNSQRTLFDIPKRKRKWLCSAIIDAFNQVMTCDPIIFDLRRNNGGDDWVAILMLSFIFGQRKHVNTNVFKSERRKQYTLSPKELQNLCGCDTLPLLKNKNIFVWISRNTFSAAELFTSILQTFGKALVIGKENSGGGANGGSNFRLNKNMDLFVPYFYCENPMTEDNWEGKGVTPDIFY
jgi:C-terminal processing protease CtpA/Prc